MSAFPLMPLCPGEMHGLGKTVLLLHMDGADASTTFTDSSPDAHVVTRAGNAQIDTAQSVFGGASGLFDGTGDWLLLDGSSDFSFGRGDFTIDFRVRFSSTAGFQGLYDMRNAGVVPSGTLVIYKHSDHSIRVVYGFGSELTGTTLTVINTWYHVEITREGNTLRLFVNGVLEASTTTDTGDYQIPASRPALGALDTGSLSSPLFGWLDEVRVIRGYAAHTATFTPPVAAYT